MEGKMEHPLNILLVLLLAVAVLVLAWKWEEARVEATVYRASYHELQKTTEHLRALLLKTDSRNEVLVERMGRMQREGFVDLSLPEEDESGGHYVSGGYHLNAREFADHIRDGVNSSGLREAMDQPTNMMERLRSRTG
jgi:hypothetical protein